MKGMDSKELKRLRARLRMTQAALAAELGVQALQVSRWERGLLAVPAGRASHVRLLVRTRPGRRSS